MRHSPWFLCPKSSTPIVNGPSCKLPPSCILLTKSTLEPRDPLDILNKNIFEEPCPRNVLSWMKSMCILDFSSRILSILPLCAYDDDLKKWTWLQMLGEEMFLNLPMKFFMGNESKGVGVPPTSANMTIANQFLLTARAIADAGALGLHATSSRTSFFTMGIVSWHSPKATWCAWQPTWTHARAYCGPHTTFWQGMCEYTPALICNGCKL